MSQRLIERDLGESLGKGGGEKSQGLKKTQVSSVTEGNLHLRHKLLQLCFEAKSAAPAADPLFFTCIWALWRCEKSEQDLVAPSSCFFADRFLVVHGEPSR